MKRRYQRLALLRIFPNKKERRKENLNINKIFVYEKEGNICPNMLLIEIW